MNGREKVEQGLREMGLTPDACQIVLDVAEAMVSTLDEMAELAMARLEREMAQERLDRLEREE